MYTVGSSVLVLQGLVLRLLLVSNVVQAQDMVNLADPKFCPQTDKTHSSHFNITDRYILAYLDGGEEQKLPRNCIINLLAPKGEGLMVYLESGYLREGGEGGCVDHIQFGMEDIIPFITLKKSKRLCGQVSKFDFVAENGALLIWLNLNRNRPKKHRETFPVVRLNFTVTPYAKKRKTHRYEKCKQEDVYIRKDFFCDGTVNCATSKGKYGFWDESDERCTPTTTQPPPSTSPPTIQTDYNNIGFESEDLRLGTIISVSLGVLVGLACCMVCCVRKCSRVPTPTTPTTPTPDDECQEMRLSGLPVPRRTLDPGSGGVGGYRAPAYAPPPPPPAEDAPPPSYSEIFPQDYAFNKDRVDSSAV